MPLSGKKLFTPSPLYKSTRLEAEAEAFIFLFHFRSALKKKTFPWARPFLSRRAAKMEESRYVYAWLLDFIGDDWSIAMSQNKNGLHVECHL